MCTTWKKSKFWAASKHHIQFTVAGISLHLIVNPEHKSSRQYVKQRHVSTLSAMSFSRLNLELEYETVHELIFRKPNACKYKPVCFSSHRVAISSNKSKQEAWKAAQTCNLCLDLIYRERQIWRAWKETRVCIWRRPVPHELHLGIATAFITDPQEANFHLRRIFMLPKTNPIVYAAPHQMSFCLSVSSAYWDVNTPRCGHGLCPGGWLSKMTICYCNATALWH